MEQNQVEEQVQEEIPPAQPKEIPAEIVQEALDTGWIPEEQFKGDKTKWRPADEWVDRGRNLIPIIKSQVKDYRSEIENLKRTIDNQKKTTEKILKMTEKVSEQSYQKALNELKKQQMEAVTNGDAEKWAQLEEAKEQLEKPEKIEIEQTPMETPVFSSWHQKNDWYGQDSDLTTFADGYGRNLQEQNPGMTFEQVLENTTMKIKEMFPNKFENPARNVPSIVDSPTISETQPVSDGKSYADLPADAKKQCNMLIEDGLIKNKEQYVKDYFEEE